MARITAVEGIGPVFASKLNAAGIKTTGALLKRASTVADRKELAAATEIDIKQILKWANKADLMRINGVGEEYSDLLEAAGVDTVPELAQRNSENLYKKLIATNDEKKLVRRPPTPRSVNKWVAQAKDMPRVLEY